MLIRKSKTKDILDIINIYAVAREIMVKSGNTSQWPAGYPEKEVILNDIEKGVSYVLEEDGVICATFCFIEGADPTYTYIEGRWFDDSAYATIHRIASNGKIKGIFKLALDFCLNINKHIRIDTHEDNIITRNLILKNGFKYCGIIYIPRDHSKRLAYERSDKIE